MHLRRVAMFQRRRHHRGLRGGRIGVLEQGQAPFDGIGDLGLAAERTPAVDEPGPADGANGGVGAVLRFLLEEGGGLRMFAQPLQEAAEVDPQPPRRRVLAQRQRSAADRGGLGVAIESYVRGIAEAVIEGCKQRGLDLPILHLEPGRSLVARAGVAIYRVGAIKQRGDKIWILTDGGMADNPRFALYGARYSCLPVERLNREVNAKVSIAGPYCESGDVVIEDLPMPELKEGELIAIPVAGAYHLSMSSNYNGARRPEVLMVEEGKVEVMLRRETVDDLLRRDP